MFKKIFNGDTAFEIIKCVIIIFSIIVSVYPLLYIFSVSISDPLEVMKGNIVLLPKGICLDSYKEVLKNSSIISGYGNTILYVVVGTALSVAITTLGAYALSNKRLIFRKFFNKMFVFTMFFGGGMIPTYLVVKWCGLLNSMWSFLLMGAVSVYNLTVMRSFFEGLPKELEESAFVDGANDLRVFFSIILPCSKAIVSTMVLFYAVGIWNSFLWPFLLLDDKTKYPLQVVLRQIIIAGDTKMSNSAGDVSTLPETIKYATIFFSILPILCVYPFVQKYFVKGVMIGGVKG